MNLNKIDNLKRARNRLGSEIYCLLTNNCQTFSTYCRFIIPENEDIKRGVCREKNLSTVRKYSFSKIWQAGQISASMYQVDPSLGRI